MSRLVNHAVKQAEGLPNRLEDIEGQEVTIVDVNFSTGTFGPYLTMVVVTANGEEIDVMTGAKLVVDALEHATEDNDLPCGATFTRKGRTWVIA